MIYKLAQTSQFKKDYKLFKKRNADLELLKQIVNKLQSGKQLDKKHCDHALQGKYKGFRECHITPDWLLIYLIENDVLT